MFKKFTQLFIYSLLVVSFISCKKVADNPPVSSGTAVYSIDGAPSICSSPVVAGLYGAGVAMTAANTVTLTVNVSVRGTYSIRTTSANGVYFAGNGGFSSTGSQTIVLTAVGTPVRDGSFAFVPSISNTCNFTISFANGLPPAVFTYTNCGSASLQGTYTTGVALDGSNYIDLGVNVTTPGTYTVVTNSANGFSFSGSGGFSATGAQSIRLIANGTPASAMPANFTPTSGCQFTVNVTAPLPPATFTCTGATANGTYTAGTALTASNTITLTLNVTNPGSYNITTTSLSNNGVTFSGTGNVAMGSQTITLRSTNTPTAAGTFFYVPMGSTCPFSITYAPAGGGGGGGGTYFLKCKINGGALIDFSTGLIAVGSQSGGQLTMGGNSGADDLQVSLLDMSNPLAIGSYKNFSFTNTNKLCVISYKAGSYLSSLLISNSFTVALTAVTATTAMGSFNGIIYDNNGNGPGTRVISEGVFSVTY